MDDKSAQEDEILAIKSIYEEDDLFTFDYEKRSGRFCIQIESEPSNLFKITFTDEKKSTEVQYLTPVILEFDLPEDYPSTSPPKFKLLCRWLSVQDLTKLCAKMDELWDQNCNTGVLFTWISFLTDELFDYLNLDKNNMKLNTGNDNISTDSRAIKQQSSTMLLENYNSDQSVFKFQKGYFSCNVCFEEKLGKECLKFNKCNHVFCNECMKGYFETQIADGNVKKLTCPQEKCESQAIPAQVLNLVGEELFNRYDSLLLKDSLNNMLDVVYCPRAKCQCAVIPEDNLARCPDCQYVFCSLCRQGYHGIEPCKITNKNLKEICNTYMNGDKSVKEDLERRYGQKRILRAIEENSSMELIENTSKQCPNCRSWMQKLDGCNKMTCSKCHCYFCWLCFKVLSKSDPYSHFNSANSECFEKLFEGVYTNVNNDDNDTEDDDDEDDREANRGLARGNNNQEEDDDDDDDFIQFLDIVGFGENAQDFDDEDGDD